MHKLITELVEEYENGVLDITILPKMIPCYFTKGHQEKSLVCWTTFEEIERMSKFKKELKKIETEILWGKD